MTACERLIDILERNPYGDVIYDFEDLANYLLQNGVIMPPVKTGDTIYILYLDDGVEPMIERAEILEVSTHRIWIDSACFDYDDIGKTVFLTCEDARKVLEKED